MSTSFCECLRVPIKVEYLYAGVPVLSCNCVCDRSSKNKKLFTSVLHCARGRLAFRRLRAVCVIVTWSRGRRARSASVGRGILWRPSKISRMRVTHGRRVPSKNLWSHPLNVSIRPSSGYINTCTKYDLYRLYTMNTRFPGSPLTKKLKNKYNSYFKLTIIYTSKFSETLIMLRKPFITFSSLVVKNLQKIPLS